MKDRNLEQQNKQDQRNQQGSMNRDKYEQTGTSQQQQQRGSQQPGLAGNSGSAFNEEAQGSSRDRNTSRESGESI